MGTGLKEFLTNLLFFLFFVLLYCGMLLTYSGEWWGSLIAGVCIVIVFCLDTPSQWK